MTKLDNRYKHLYNPEHPVPVLSVHRVPMGDGQDVKLGALLMGLYSLARKLELTHRTFEKKTTGWPTIKHQAGGCKLQWEFKRKSVKG